MLVHTNIYTMSAQESKTKNKSAVDSLLETKLTTDSKQKLEIKSGGFSFHPKLIKSYEGQKEITIPSLDGIASDFKNSDNVTVASSSDIDDDLEDDLKRKSLETPEFRNYLISFFMSEEYYNYQLNKDNVKDITRYNVPVVAILAQKEDGSMVHILIQNPFKYNCTTKLFKLIETNQSIYARYNNKNKLCIDLGDGDILPASINNVETMNIQKSFVDGFDETFCWEYLDDSEYPNWMKMSVTSFEKRDNGKYELSIENISYPWILDDPEFWNDSHETVKLVEEFANGNPSLLENVYIRPNNETMKSSLQTIKNKSGWEMAIEKPVQSNDIESISGFDVVILFALTVSTLFSFLTLINF